MAHAIIFNDRAPRTFVSDKLKINPSYYNYPSGAYKIASVLRRLGLTVLVVDNCFNFTFEGIKQIIDNNQKDLLWVGMATSLMMFKSSAFIKYREDWNTSTKLTLDLNIFIGTGGSADGIAFSATEITALPWGDLEIAKIAQYCKKFNAPLLIGGSWVTYTTNGNFKLVHPNIKLVPGYAEKYVEEFTLKKLKDSKYRPPVAVSNEEYNT